MANDLLVALGVSFSLTQTASLMTTIYLHRTLTHRAIALNRTVAQICRAGLWLLTGIVPREWVAVHRKHHAHTDVEGDPHSPRLTSLRHILTCNIFDYVREKKAEGVVEKFAKDIEDESWIWKHRPFSIGIAGPLTGTVILFAVMGYWGLLAAGVHAVGYIFLSACINGICHHSGYRNFENTATNVGVLALLTCGEGLHNNHHGFPRSPKFSCKAREIDLAWPVVRLLKLLGLAEPYKTIEQMAE